MTNDPLAVEVGKVEAILTRLEGKVDRIETQLSDFHESRVALEARIAKLEAQLEAQLEASEADIAELKDAQRWLTRTAATALILAVLDPVLAVLGTR